MKHYLPINFNLEQHLAQYPTSEIKAFCPDKLHCILSLPIQIPANNKDLRTPNGFVPINARALKDAIGNDYKTYLDYLVRTGVLDAGNEQYLAGVKSRMYRYTKDIRQGFKSVDILKTFNFKIKKEVSVLDTQRLERLESKIGKHLKTFFRKDKLELDIDTAQVFLYQTILERKTCPAEGSFLNLKLRQPQVNTANWGRLLQKF